MDAAETLIHHEGSISPSLPHIFSTVKSEPTDFWNPPQTPPDSYSTYTPLETFHPLDSSPYSPYWAIVNGVAPPPPSSYGSYVPALCPSSYSGPGGVLEDPDDQQHPGLYRNPDLMLYPRDEGLGSSPSSLNSASPPSSVAHGDPGTPGGHHHYFEGPHHERSSPGDSAFSEEQLPMPRLIVQAQCVKCGTSNSDIWWRDGTGHFLCGSCNQGRSVPTVGHHQVDEFEMNERKRKRPTSLNKKDNQTCTNCEAVSTSLWRRNLAGEVVCNACGLYEKLHKCARPISMKKDTIQTRKRKPRGTGSKKKMSDVHVNAIKKEFASTASPPYSLPNYNSLHLKDHGQLSHMQHLNESVLLPAISTSPSYYPSYKPELSNSYHLMSPSVITMPLESMSKVAPSSPANT